MKNNIKILIKLKKKLQNHFISLAKHSKTNNAMEK